MKYTSFPALLDKYSWKEVADSIHNVSIKDVDKVLQKSAFGIIDLPVLLSIAAGERLYLMKKIAHELTNQYFGKARFLYAPLYITNICINGCVYCGFNKNNSIKRKRLTMSEIESDAAYIYNQGFRHILIVTGEDVLVMNSDYLIDAIKTIRSKFSSISIEVQPLTELMYKKTVESGCDGLSLYQETYNKQVYKAVHVRGPKSNYKWRVNAPERAAKSGMKRINFGVLLGLTDFRTDVWFAALHASYIRKKYWKTQIGFSFPRINSNAGSYHPAIDVEDNDFMQLIFALRMVFPQAQLFLSTREQSEFRDMLLAAAVTNTSAGSKTNPGGYTIDDSTGQFDISDTRSPKEVVNAIKAAGYNPIYKDWDIGLA